MRSTKKRVPGIENGGGGGVNGIMSSERGTILSKSLKASSASLLFSPQSSCKPLINIYNIYKYNMDIPPTIARIGTVLGSIGQIGILFNYKVVSGYHPIPSHSTPFQGISTRP